MKNYLDINVLEASKERIAFAFDNFEKIYISFSGGKDSSVMFHLVMDEAVKRKVRVGVLVVDLEAQYNLTIQHISEMVEEYQEYIDLYWVCLPITLRNSVSVYEPTWICWDRNIKKEWVRMPPKCAITDEKFFPFFQKGMEFEEFVPLFGLWYSDNKPCACFVGIRTEESLNRYRSITSHKKLSIKISAIPH